jgi:hypothetical protein
MLAVPIVPDLDRPERRTLADSDGTPPVRFVYVERDGRVVADLFELEVPVQRALPVILAELRGMRVAGSEELGRALVAAGATPARHAHVYSHDKSSPTCRRRSNSRRSTRGLPRRRAAFGGPWVMEVFREPGARGAGKALLQRALVLSEGSLGLAVTHGNPAERVYASLGFKRIFTAYSVDL